MEQPTSAIGSTSSSIDFDLPPDSKYAQTGLLEPFALADQPTHQVYLTKQPDMIGTSQKSNKPLIDLNEDSQSVNSTVDLRNYKEPVFEWDGLLAELHDMVSLLLLLFYHHIRKATLYLFGLNSTSLIIFGTKV